MRIIVLVCVADYSMVFYALTNTVRYDTGRFNISWLVQSNPLEVSPIDDIREHDSGEDCWCAPFMDAGVIVHNALDEREKFENRIRKPN
jgi:hypothetical protein